MIPVFGSASGRRQKMRLGREAEWTDLCGRPPDRRSLRSAVRQVIREHRKHNAPVVIWRNGRTAWVPADDLKTNRPADSCSEE